MRWHPALLLICTYAGLATSYQLPRTITPSHYDLFLTFDLDSTHSFPFFGVVKILIKASEETNKIVLHAQDFTIDNERVTITNAQGTDYPIASVNLNDTFNFLTICSRELLEPNKVYTLVIPFSGNLKDDLDGIYTSYYIDKKTKAKEYLIASQFEAISARKGFPCFDEPIFKATFSINIGHDKIFTAISNLPLQNSSNDNPMEDYWPWKEINQKFMISKSSMVWDQFEVSVPMSTYVVALVISKFEYVESLSELTKAKFKIWARSDALYQTKYASKIGPEILAFYENWFNVSFPLPKVDMIAIPDFSAGAMENWGLVTYRETALLYDIEESSMLNKERVAEVVAHELAHQWFGNLVTMKWWSDLWLNEGFATHVASIGMNAVEPHWKVYETEAVDQTQTVWNKDKMATSHPVSVPLDDPKRISEIFDEISYRKGAVLIRMMTKFLGEDVFRKAINKYLVKYSYSNAEQDDLWTELTEVSKQYGVLIRNVSIKEVMDTWTKQTGYPLLTVNRNYNDQTLRMKQKRYLALGSVAPNNSSWWVPLRVLCQGDSPAEMVRPLEWLAQSEGVKHEVEFNHDAGPDEWVLFNADLIAPYRLNYDKKNWDLLIKTLNSDKFKTIPTLSRVQLLSDSFELASNNILHYSTALELANYLHQETEYSPLQTGLSVLSGIGSILIRSPEYGAYQKFIRKLITPAYERSGGIIAKKERDPDDILSVKMQVGLSEHACHAEVPGCQENAIELFQRWMDSDTPNEDNPIPLDLRYTVYCVAISRGGVSQWRFLLQREQENNLASQRTTMLRALTCTRDVWLLNQFLEWAIGGVEVRTQDSGMVIGAITRSPVGFYLAKNFLYNRIEEIFKHFKSQSRRFGHIFTVLLAQFTTQKEIDEFLEWRKCNAKYLEDAKLAIDQAVEKANINIAWISKNKETVVKLLRKFAG